MTKFCQNCNHYDWLIEISNNDMRDFVQYVLHKYPEYEMVPSSKSGKWHPSDEYSIGGNALHVSRVLRVLNHLIVDDAGGLVGKLFAEPYNYLPLSQHEKDVLKTAAILHDLNKITNKRGADVSPLLVKDELVHYYGLNWQTKAPWGSHLIELVAVHGGAFYKPFSIDSGYYLYDPNIKLHYLLHISDYIASRNDVLINVHEGFDRPNKPGLLKKFLMKQKLKFLIGDKNNG